MYSLAYDVCNIKFHATLQNFVELKDLFDHVLDRKFYLYGCTCSNCVVPVKDINLSRDPSTCSLKVIVEQIPKLKDETNSESNPPNKNSKQETTPEQFPPSTDSVSQKKKKKNQKTKQLTEAKTNFKTILTEIENKTTKTSQTETCCLNKKSKANEINKNNDSNPIETEAAATTSTEIKRSEKVEDTKETAILQKNDIHTLKSNEATSPIADFDSSDDNELLSCNSSESEFSSPAFQKQPYADTEKVEDPNKTTKPLKEAIGTFTKSKSNDSEVLDIKSTDNSKVFCDDNDEVTPAEKHQQLDAGRSATFSKGENSRQKITKGLELDSTNDLETLSTNKVEKITYTLQELKSLADHSFPSILQLFTFNYEVIKNPVLFGPKYSEAQIKKATLPTSQERDLSSSECHHLLNDLIGIHRYKSTPFKLHDKWNSLSTNQHADFLCYVLNFYLHAPTSFFKRNDDYLHLFIYLLRENLFTMQDFRKGYLKFSETCHECIGGWERAFKFLGPLLYLNLIAFETLWDRNWFNTIGAMRFLEGMICHFKSNVGQNYVIHFWKNNSLQWNLFLAEDKILPFIRAFGFQFIRGKR